MKNKLAIIILICLTLAGCQENNVIYDASTVHKTECVYDSEGQIMGIVNFVLDKKNKKIKTEKFFYDGQIIFTNDYAERLLKEPKRGQEA